jgi:DNA 3'-phosphatase
MKDYRIIFVDLDGTLINTLSGETFPLGVWDMKLNLSLLDSIKRIKPDYVFVVSNQGGIEKGYVNKRNFNDKLQYIADCVNEYIGHDCICKTAYCHTNDEDSYYRKPNIGMLEHLMKNFAFDDDYLIDKENICMIGDASGKEGQFSNTDKQTAINFGIDYYDVNDFIKAV